MPSTLFYFGNSSHLSKFIFHPHVTLNDSSADITYELGSLTKGVLGFIMIVMCIIAVAGNLLVIIIIVATKQFHSITSIFLINLAVSDLLVGVGVMPFVATSVIYNRWINHQYLCLYMGYAFVVYCTSSVLTLAAIALDRYRAIIDCFRYNTQTTMKRAICTVIWIWTQAVFSGFPPFMGWGHFEYLPATFSCSVNWAYSPSYTGLVMCCSFLVPTCAMVFCYIRIVQVARDHARRIHNIECQLQKNVKPKARFLEPDPKMSPNRSEKISPDSNCSDSQNSTDNSHLPVSGLPPSMKQDIFAIYNTPGRENNGTFRLFLVIWVFFCCWVPYIIVSLLQSITLRKNLWKFPPQLLTLSAWLALLNSAINPLLYALLSKRFRKALSHLKQRMLFKMDFLLQDGAVMANSGDAKTKIKRIHLLRSPSHLNHFENKLYLRSLSMFSIASFADTGQDDDCIPMQFSGLAPSAIWRSQDTTSSSELYQDGLLLKPEAMTKQYLEIPCLPFEPQSPCQLRGEDKADSSIFIFGNITVKINENNVVCSAEP